MIVLRCIDNLKTILLWKPWFDPYDPKWSQVDRWPHNIGRGPNVMCMHGSYGQAILYRRTIAFKEKMNVLTPVTPNDHRLTFYPTE